ncbi:seven-hairpin glycosidase [Exidia glandulosa HHB12029]|uniref:alpha-1,2-Mannosidase n=1 Tax=Exidia glandulosa HHB12029 TaxID=1314781 RepID=A0A165K6D6_EXIGL|nr:seven-hairpin glycosidase [Exidia glandulosa HHB12029]
MLSPALLLLAPAVAQAASVQLAGLTLPDDAPTHAAAVKKIFTDAYGSYKEKAWGFDDLAPLSGQGTNGRNGWGATVIDALSTMSVMGLDDLFAEGVDFASKIDFSTSHTEDTVSVFETTIRYLGGLLAAYELSGSKHEVLVQKATEVADKMAFAWVGDNDVPYGFLNFTTNEPTIDGSNIAEAGTLILEWNRLSELTGNKTYGELAEKSFRHIATTNDTLLPSLPGQCINPTTGGWDCRYITWGGGSDSYFEYLIKYARLTNNADPLWVESWKTAVESTVQNLIVTSDVGGWAFVADFTDDKVVRHIGTHLGCFIGGNWIMGGRLLGNETIVKYGLSLVDGCIATYNTTTGIGPEVFAYSSKDGNYTGATPSADDLAFYQEHGWYVYNGAGYYILRPEVMESNFYAYRATGDERYYQNAVRFIDSLNNSTSVNGANAGIGDVRQEEWGASGFFDDTESFFFAEVLKYLYLTFDDPAHISLDEWTFNTEAHPLKAPPALDSYEPKEAKKSAKFRL